MEEIHSLDILEEERPIVEEERVRRDVHLYLSYLLVHLGFGSKWRKWMCCISMVQFSIRGGYRVSRCRKPLHRLPTKIVG
jgi:hypothetical protein